MAKSSQATASAFGWDFQSNAAIVLMLKNISIASSVKVEGEHEDIEIVLDNKQKIFAQAKAVERPYDDFSHVIEKLKAGLRTLNAAASQPNVCNLIYITNSPNPFNSSIASGAFIGGGLTSLSYDELPSDCKQQVDDICQLESYDFDRSHLTVFVLHFYGADDNLENRYKIIKEKVNEILGEFGVGDRGWGSQMLEIWQREFQVNTTQRTARITKGQMIWPIIVMICKVGREDIMLDDYDEGDIDEILCRYESIINNNAERYEFMSKVMSAYNAFEPALSSKKRTEKFVNEQWATFRSDFDMPSTDGDIVEKVIRLTIHNIIRRRHSIQSIKNRVNL